MTYQEIINWLAQDIIDTTEEKEHVEANVDRYLEDLADAVREKTEQLAEAHFKA
jgi:non-homologous end joining protein Ku